MTATQIYNHQTPIHLKGTNKTFNSETRTQTTYTCQCLRKDESLALFLCNIIWWNII